MSRPAHVDVDDAWLEQTLLTLLRTPTGVPPERTGIEPGDPRITGAVEEVLLPIVSSLEPDELRRHELGDVAARFGPPDDDGLLVQVYVVSQHGNLMEDPTAARVADGREHGLRGPVAIGQGANQNKGPMAAVLAALRDRPPRLARPVWLAVNTEGSSSHGGSRRILDDLDVRAGHGIVSIATDLDVSVGNRGRVDVHVTVPGASCHSSQPWLGSNPIEGAADVVIRLRSTPLPPAHAELGEAQVTPYQLLCSPIAPHTVPEEALVVVDRRLLPGEDVAEAVEALRAHLDGLDPQPVVVRDVEMLPAAVDVDAPAVAALRAGVAAGGERTSAAVWSRNTFDAGYACSKGIPTCMFGPGVRSFSKDLTATEVVALDDCVAAAGAIRHTIDALCT